MQVCSAEAQSLYLLLLNGAYKVMQTRASGGATGGLGGTRPPFVTRIDFLIRPNPKRNCRGRGEISQRFFNISLNCLP